MDIHNARPHDTEPTDLPPPRHQPAVSRRALLGVGGALTAAGLAGMLGAAPAGASPRGRAGEIRLGLVTDTHINPDQPARAAWTRRTYEAIARRQPDAVLHCGDITDTGIDEQLQLAGDLVPDSLRGKFHYAPGNHEVRWDTSAKEVLDAHVGSGSFSFDVDGLHVIGYDPTLTTQEPGHVGAEGLAWLRADLAKVSPGTPVVLFQHYPIAGSYYYLDDQDAMLELLSQHNLRLFLAGHIHRQTVTPLNGFTEVTLDAIKNGPTYYWVSGDEQRLSIVRVQLADDDTETETLVAEIPLRGARTGAELRPVQATARPSGSIVEVEVALGPDATPTRVVAAAYAQDNWGGSVAPQWQELRRTGGVWRGSLTLPPVPGLARIWLAVESADSAWWQTLRVQLPAPGGAPVIAWERRLTGGVQAGLAPAGRGGDLAAAASTQGQVLALQPQDGRPRWQQRLGPVHRGPAGDGDLLLVPSADHTLTALVAATGRVWWRADLGAPVIAEPLLIGGRQGTVVVSVGEDLVALDAARGVERWRVAGRGCSAGRVASDGEAVYGCATDGYARAHGLADGQERWAFQMRARNGDTNGLILYSGWNDRTEVVDGVVLAASVSATWGLDAATGTVRWSIKQSAMYANTIVLDDGDVILASELGVVMRVQAATGVVRWQTDLRLRILDGGLVRQGERVWAESTGGQLIGLELADGREVGRIRHTLAYGYSTPVAIDQMIVVGDLDGVVRGIRVSG